MAKDAPKLDPDKTKSTFDSGLVKPEKTEVRPAQVLRLEFVQFHEPVRCKGTTTGESVLQIKKFDMAFANGLLRVTPKDQPNDITLIPLSNIKCMYPA
jgi:hypothetical protein